jgi:peptidylprolyl isomerase
LDLSKQRKEDKAARAKYGDTVVVYCKAKLGNNTAMTSPSRGRNLKFTLGEGYVIEDIEKTVVGMKPSESRIATIFGEKLFGPHRQDNIIEIERNNLYNFKLKIGKRIRIPGHPFSVKVLDVSESKVTVDANHPLSNRNLIFSVKLVGIV